MPITPWRIRQWKTDGVMKMREVEGLELKPGDMITFAPGGYHIMLIGLKAPLKVGDSFPLTLTFQVGRRRCRLT